jgi:hypothetical protein
MQRAGLATALLSMLLLSGCGTLGLGGSEDSDSKGNDSETQSEEDNDPRSEDAKADKRVVIPDSSDDGDSDLLSGIFGSDEPAARANQAETAKLRQEIARLQASMQNRQPRRRPASTANRTGPGVAVVFPNGAALRAPMLSALNQAAGSFPMRIMSPGDVKPVLKNYGCSVAAPQDCLSALAVQPGARLLAVVEPLPANENRERRIRFRFYDTDLGLRYDPVTLALPRGNAETENQSWIAAADAVLIHAQDHLQLTPTIVHAVKTEGETVYLNQGKAADLTKGSRLVVHRDGRLIRGAADIPVTWIPGQASGIVEITRVTNSGRAIGRVVEGQAPSPSDFLIPSDNGQG